MKNVDPSQYFEPVEGFMSANPYQTSIAVINGLLRGNGCPDELINQVVNGAMADLLMKIIAPQKRSVQTFDQNGNVIPDNRVNPTKEELVEFLIQERFSYLTRDRAEKLLDFLIQKSALTEGADGTLYLTKYMLPRQLIQL